MGLFFVAVLKYFSNANPQVEMRGGNANLKILNFCFLENSCMYVSVPNFSLVFECHQVK